MLVAQGDECRRRVVTQITVEKQRVQPLAVFFRMDPADQFRGHFIERGFFLAVVQVRGDRKPEFDLAAGLDIFRGDPPRWQDCGGRDNSGGFEKMAP